MLTSLKLLICGSIIALLGAIQPTSAAAGWMDKIGQAAQTYNNASQQVQQLKNAGQQAQQLKTVADNAAAAKQAAQSGAQAAGQAPAAGGDRFAKTQTTNVITGEWGNQVTCAGPNTATCQNGMDNLVNCMHQTKGYYYRLVAAKLQGRLDSDPDLTQDDRSMLTEDIVSLNDAVETDKVVDPDPEYPQRWFAWLDKEDQTEIQKANSKYMNEVRADCDKRFGGMNF